MGNIFGNGTALLNNGPDVVSDSSIEVTDIQLNGVKFGEKWDRYKKTYWKNWIGQDLFNAPRTVTNPKSGEKVNILCQCRFIHGFFYAMNENGKKISADPVWIGILNGSVKPACWEEDVFGNGTTYWINYKDPGFYAYSANKDGVIGMATDYAKSIKDGTAAKAGLFGVEIPLPSMLDMAAVRAATAKGGSRRKRRASKKVTRRLISS